MKTRSKNKEAHPGLVVNNAKQKRRTAEQMELVRAQEAHAQEEKQKNLRIAAAVEDKHRHEDIERRRTNHRAGALPAFRPPPQDDDVSTLSTLAQRETNNCKYNFLGTKF